MSAVQPLAETVVDDWDAARTHLAENTSTAAYDLTELTALLDAELHHLVLDPQTRTIWWAYDNSPLDGEGWTVQQLSPSDAAAQLSAVVDLIQDRQDDLTEYVDRHADLDRDQEALDEYAAVLLLALPVEPAEAAVTIKWRRRQIAREGTLQQRAYAQLVAELAGTEHGGKTHAGRVLGVTDVQIGRIIREDQQRRTALADTVRAARQTSD
ncbi:hypothetical protein ACIQNG_33795 [Streptomyces sp. NPDC091377]|uniref:hypothetical protein n=1 Tax=Streptomyces sp. NPDC091377 TaxID=3365995 RepID=UPI00380F2D36